MVKPIKTMTVSDIPLEDAMTKDFSLPPDSLYVREWEILGAPIKVSYDNLGVVFVHGVWNLSGRYDYSVIFSKSADASFDGFDSGYESLESLKEAFPDLFTREGTFTIEIYK